MGSHRLSPEQSRRFVESLTIDPPERTRGAKAIAESLESLKPTYTESQQAVVIGSQIAEFEAGIPAAMRSQISNSFLLAQLAAKKMISQNGGGAREWFEKYVDVLTSIGWIGEGIAVAGHEVRGDTLQAHKEIVTVIATALGPAAAAASVVLAALNGLKEMTENSPWITLFDRQSQSKTVQQFHCARPGGGQRCTCRGLGLFRTFGVGISHPGAVLQVLFVQCQTAPSSSQLSMNEAAFDEVKDLVKEKIAEHVSGMISAIDI